MGFDLTWLLFTGTDREGFFRDLGVKPTGVLIDDVVDGIAGRAHGEESYLVVAAKDQGRYIDPFMLETLSRAARLLVCHLHEGCMVSHAAAWVAGNEIWHVIHDSEKGAEQIDVAGDPPAALARIRLMKEKAQETENRRRRKMPVRRTQSDLPPDLMAYLKDVGGEMAPSSFSMGVNHMVDVPVALCESLTGLRHDNASFWHAAKFETLVPIAYRTPFR